MALVEMSTLRWNTATARNVLCILCWFSFLEYVQGLMTIVEEQRQAFIQTNHELRNLVDGISLHLQEGLLQNTEEFISQSTLENTRAYVSLLKFYPPTLDFREQPVGMPQQRRVVVANLSYHINVFLLSVSGSSVHFHCSFFRDKVIPPGDNTTFDIIFLARHEGPVHSMLYIHTSVGTFDYQVEGIGLPNPYRLRPFIGARVPLHTVFSPLINIYNPHNSTLQVMEMYSSGGDLHLELTTGDREATKDLWEILPYQSKPVMQATFLARVESNHTVYVCIKTNHSKAVDLVLPFEVEVTSAPGIYSITDSLDFGVVYEKDDPRILSLNVLNHKVKQIYISSIDMNPPNQAVTLDFHPIKLQPDTACPTTVATVTLHPSKVTDSSHVSGNLVIKTRTKEHKLVLPFHAVILRGSLHYNVSATQFYVGKSRTNDPPRQSLVLQNTFAVGIAVLNIELPPEAKLHFKVHLEKDVVLQPNETKVLGVIALMKNSTNIKMNTHIRLNTNISQFELPILCYDGKLTLYVALPWNSTKLDIGTLSYGENKNVVFAVLNDNPINVTIRRFGATLPHLILELLTIGSGNVTDALQQQNFVGNNKSMALNAGQYSVFRVGVTAPTMEGSFQGFVFIETQFEDLRIPFTFKTANGFLAVIPQSLTFEPSFPGKVATTYLYIQSTFSQPMTVTSVTTTITTRTGISYQPPKGSLPVLQPNANTFVGKLHFDIQQDCGSQCYSAFDLSSRDAYKWLLGMKLLHNVGSVDDAICRKLWTWWIEIVESQKACINFTLLVNTNEVHGLLVHAHAFLVWPSLTVKTKLKFPLTQIGNSSLKEILLENPSSKPIIVQLVPLNVYPDFRTVLTSLKDRGLSFSPLSHFSLGRYMFAMHDPICTKASVLTEVVGVVPHDDTLVIQIEPGGKVIVPVQFTPSNEAKQLSLVLIRNNLTGLEAVEFEGIGDHGQLRLGSQGTTMDSHVLQFKLTEKHLQNCDIVTARMQHSAPVFTARRVFQIFNSGKLPVYIKGFDIDGTPCMGFGFGVLSCQPFILPPNSSEKLDIVFTPDFTLARVTRQLNIRTSLSHDQILNITLIATLPPHLLAHCAAALPRPPWEAVVYYVSISVMCFLFLCIMIAGYLEYDRIIRCRCITMMVTGFHQSLDHGDYSTGVSYGKIFDLKSIAMKTSYQTKELQQSSIHSVLSSEHSVGLSDNGAAINLTERLSPSGSQMFSKTSLNCRTLMGVKNKPSVGSLCTKDKDACDHTVICKNANGKKKGKKKSLVLRQRVDETCCPLAFSKVNKSFNSMRKSSSGDSAVQQSVECPKSLSCQDNHRVDRIIDNADFKKVCLGYQKHKNDMFWTGGHNAGKHKQLEKTKFTSVEKYCPNKGRHVVSVDPMEEETSSTTTESSCAEVDSSEKNDKNSTTRKVKWPVSESRAGTDSSKVDEADDEEDFEVITRSRLRKIRDHHQHSQMESHAEKLPGSLQSSVTESHRNCRDLSKKGQRQGMPLKSKQLKKSSSVKCRALKRQSNDTESSSTGKDSPPPEWDSPKCVGNMDEAYNELANQTENFALRVQKTKCSYSEKASPLPSMPHGWKFKSREKSFWNSPGDANRLLPIGKVAPEPKMHDPKLLGPVGQKPFSSAVQLPNYVNPWSPSLQRKLANQISSVPYTSIENNSHYCLPQFLESEHSPSHPFNMSPSPTTPPAFSGLTNDPLSSAYVWNKNKGLSVTDNDSKPLFANEDNNWFNVGSQSSCSDNVWDINSSSNNVWFLPKGDQHRKLSNSWNDNLIGKPSTSTWPSLLAWPTTEPSGNSDTTFHFAKSPALFEQTAVADDQQSYPVAEYNPFSSPHTIWTPRTSQEMMNDNRLKSPVWPVSEIASHETFTSSLKTQHQ